MSDEELADKHWEYTKEVILLSDGQVTFGLLEYLYKQALKHGIKHGRDDDKDRPEENKVSAKATT